MLEIQRKFAVLLTIAAMPAAMIALPKPGLAAPILGDANSFSVLAGGSLNNTGTSAIVGEVSVSGDGTVSGFAPPTTVTGGSIHINDGMAVSAMGSFLSAYNALGLATVTLDLSAFGDLGSAIPVLTGGVYQFTNNANLNGSLTLNGCGVGSTGFTFLVGGNFSSTAGSSINLTNGANFNNVNFVVSNNATLGAGGSFQGSILAGGDITVGAGTSISCGRILAQGDISIDSSEIEVTADCLAAAALAEVPEPGSMALLGFGLLGLAAPTFRRRK